tara:strand:- start:420 stop:617 length:198 start_codon:yes stop_codon:yes gene_type:complete
MWKWLEEFTWDVEMKLILTNSDGLVIDQWDIKQDIDLPDLEELTQCLYDAGFYDDEQKALMDGYK